VNARLIAGLVVGALAAWLLVALFRPERQPAPTLAFSSSEQCKECHEEVYAEWKSSWHALAFVDEQVRELSNDFSNADCVDCHAPRPVFETGIGNRVLPRTARRVEGVDCIACHLLPDGTVAGTITNPNAPCRPVERRELVQVELCASCHDQHGTVQQWRASQYPAAGQDCRECHMPFRSGSQDQGGRDHRMLGGHDPALLARAVELRGRAEGGGFVVEVENVGAGHNYPTDERSRASDVFWRPAGEERWRHLHRFRNPYRHEVDLPNTELPAHASVSLEIAGDIVGDSTERVEVALFYKLSPYWQNPDEPDPEREATLVHKITLER
jgi:hypothetical protein